MKEVESGWLRVERREELINRRWTQMDGDKRRGDKSRRKDYGFCRWMKFWVDATTLRTSSFAFLKLRMRPTGRPVTLR